MENADVLTSLVSSLTEKETVLNVRLLSIGLRKKKNVLNVTIIALEVENTSTIRSKFANALKNILIKTPKANAEDVKSLEFGMRNKRNVSVLAISFGTKRNKSANVSSLTLLINMETVKTVLSQRSGKAKRRNVLVLMTCLINTTELVINVNKVRNTTMITSAINALKANLIIMMDAAMCVLKTNLTNGIKMENAINAQFQLLIFTKIRSVILALKINSLISTGEAATDALKVNNTTKSTANVPNAEEENTIGKVIRNAINAKKLSLNTMKNVTNVLKLLLTTTTVNATNALNSSLNTKEDVTSALKISIGLMVNVKSASMAMLKVQRNATNVLWISLTFTTKNAITARKINITTERSVMYVLKDTFSMMENVLNANMVKSTMMASATNVPREKLKLENTAALHTYLITTMINAENVLKTKNTNTITYAMFVLKDTSWLTKSAELNVVMRLLSITTELAIIARKDFTTMTKSATYVQKERSNLKENAINAK